MNPPVLDDAAISLSLLHKHAEFAQAVELRHQAMEHTLAHIRDLSTIAVANVPFDRHAGVLRDIAAYATSVLAAMG